MQALAGSSDLFGYLEKAESSAPASLPLSSAFLDLVKELQPRFGHQEAASLQALLDELK